MKNRFKGIMGILIVLVMFSTGSILLHAEGTLRLSGVPKNMNIGDTFTITVSTPEGTALMSIDYPADLLEYTGSSEGDECLGGKGLRTVNPVDGKATLSFRAISAGSGTISLTSDKAGDAEGNDTIFSPTSASFVINNASSGGSTPGDTDPGDGTTETKSADNSLKSLTISPGTLSPKFQYNVHKYTASVDESVTSIAVVAEPSNEKASVVSVTGKTNLKVGENTVEITVKAENGTTAVYKIIVTRGGTASEEPEKPDDESTNTPTGGTSNKSIVIDGKAYKVSATLPEEELPREFKKTTVTYNKQKVEAYTFHYEELVLLYLKPVSSKSGTTGKFYFYNEKADEFFPYINIDMGKTYAVILPNSFAETLPTGYEETELDIEDYSVTACRPITEDTETENEFYLVYGVDKDGNTGWYQYDSVDLSLQRFNEVENVSGETQAELSAYKEAYTNLQDKYNKERVTSRKVMAVLIVVLVIAIFAIINILLFKSGKFDKKSDDRDDDVDYVDLDEM